MAIFSTSRICALVSPSFVNCLMHSPVRAGASHPKTQYGLEEYPAPLVSCTTAQDRSCPRFILVIQEYAPRQKDDGVISIWISF